MGFIMFFLVLFIFKSAKKHIAITFIKMMFFFALIFIILVILGNYVDLSEFFSQDSTVVKTGAAVIDVFKSNLG